MLVATGRPGWAQGCGWTGGAGESRSKGRIFRIGLCDERRQCEVALGLSIWAVVDLCLQKRTRGGGFRHWSCAQGQRPGPPVLGGRAPAGSSGSARRTRTVAPGGVSSAVPRHGAFQEGRPVGAADWPAGAEGAVWAEGLGGLAGSGPRSLSSPSQGPPCCPHQLPVTKAVPGALRADGFPGESTKAEACGLLVRPRLACG